MSRNVQPVTDAHQVKENLMRFNHEAPAHAKCVQNILGRTTYWVFDPASSLFGPSKFLGYSEMDFERYEEESIGKKRRGASGRMTGGEARSRIEESLASSYRSDKSLHEPLRQWGTSLFGHEVFGKAKSDKWKFVVLAGVRGRNQRTATRSHDRDASKASVKQTKSPDDSQARRQRPTVVDAPKRVPVTVSRRPKIALGDETTEKHDPRCHHCKSTIYGLLHTIYGNVEHKFKAPKVSVRLGDFERDAFFPQLRSIFVALQNHRGFRNFVRAKTLQRCDLFIPSLGAVVELDETQHFTELRAIAIERYPKALPVGYDRAWYIGRCRRLRQRDNDPEFRDEQRAWYDTIRDFLPWICPQNVSHPTVRIPLGFRAWCSLDPTDKRDVASFRELIGI